MSVSLTAANHVLHLERWWNPAVEDQATTARTASVKRKMWKYIRLSPFTLSWAIGHSTVLDNILTSKDFSVHPACAHRTGP